MPGGNTGIFASSGVSSPLLQWKASGNDQFTFNTTNNVSQWKVNTGTANPFTNQTANVYPTYNSTKKGVVFSLAANETLVVNNTPTVNLFKEASIYLVFQLNANSSWAYGHLFVQVATGASVQQTRIYCDWGSTSACTMSAEHPGVPCPTACRQMARRWHKTVHMPLGPGHIFPNREYILARITINSTNLKYYAGKMASGTQSAIKSGTRSGGDTSLSPKDWAIGQGGRMTIHEVKSGHILPKNTAWS